MTQDAKAIEAAFQSFTAVTGEHLDEHAQEAIRDAIRAYLEVRDGEATEGAIAYASAGQISSFEDRPGDEGGIYIPLRKTPAGMFQMPIFAALTRNAEPVAEAHGWIYFNEDTGTEWSENHPVGSGEVPDATDIRPCSAETRYWIDELAKRDEELRTLRAIRSAVSTNYIADDDTHPTKVTFSDGRIVSVTSDGYLNVGRSFSATPPAAQTGTVGSDERAAFEDWALADHRDIQPNQDEERHPNNYHYYDCDSTNNAYIGWHVRSATRTVGGDNPLVAFLGQKPRPGIDDLYFQRGIRASEISKRLARVVPEAGAITTEMVNAAYNKAKELRMTGLPSEFRQVLEAALSAPTVEDKP